MSDFDVLLVGGGMLLLTSALAMLNAHALGAWADGLEPGARTARISAVAHNLADQAATRGLDGPRAALKQQWDRVKAARWPDQASGNQDQR